MIIKYKKMKNNNLNNIFERFLESKNIFKNKAILQSTFHPDNILHRDEQINLLANILAPSLRNEKPSNIFLYGKTGTGKTLTTQYITNNMMEIAKEKKVPLLVFYINCKLRRVADTEYRLVAQLAREFGKEIPPTGLPTDEVYNIFINTLEKKKKNLILILDEIDQLVNKAGDEIIYNLTRINTDLKNSSITIIGISNNLTLTNELDPRVKSSLSEEEIVFSPYNAMQLQEILYQRSKQAFNDNVIEQGVIEKCAAYAAREHGDARRALELLRVAGEICERNTNDKIKIEHIDEAENKIERDKFIDIILTQPKQFHIILYSIFETLKNKKTMAVYTGEIYEYYKYLSNKINIRPLTQRRVSDIIGELDMIGLINAKVVSHGRFGRTREIKHSLTSTLKNKIRSLLEENLLEK